MRKTFIFYNYTTSHTLSIGKKAEESKDKCQKNNIQNQEQEQTGSKQSNLLQSYKPIHL